MRKVVLAIIAVTITTFSVIGQDFRNSTWGMTPNQVKSSEDSKLIEESSELLIYETTLAGYETMAGYIFVKGKLVRAKYILTEEYSNNNEYISDYEYLKSLLNKKYGEPVEDEIDWKSDFPIKNDKSHWGFAIGHGDLVLYSVYKTSNTDIELTVYAEDYRVINEIQYSSTDTELKNLEEEKILEGF